MGYGSLFVVPTVEALAEAPLLLQGLEHWEEVFAVLQGDTLSLFKDTAAAAQVENIKKPLHH